MEIKEKNILITGGSQGLGECLCRYFAALGAHVFINCANHPERAEKLASELHCDTAVFDIADSEKVNAFFRNVPIDILVNNARLDPYSRSETISDADFFDRCIAVNLKGAYLCSLAVINSMRQRKSEGRIINVSSVWANRAATRPMLEYAMSKAALNSLTRSLANLCGKDNITVNAVSPGLILTESLHRRKTPEEIAAMVRNIPIGRVSAPEEIASAIEFFIRNHSTTGAVLDIDGGANLNR